MLARSQKVFLFSLLLYAVGCLVWWWPERPWLACGAALLPLLVFVAVMGLEFMAMQRLNRRDAVPVASVPQLLRAATNAAPCDVVSLFKESALISSVGVADLMFVGQNISNSTARPVEFLSAVAVIYILVAFPLTRLVGVVEGRLLRRYAY